MSKVKHVEQSIMIETEYDLLDRAKNLYLMLLIFQ